MDKLLWKTIHKCEFNKEDDYLERILTQAGVEDIYEFLHVNKSHTHSPFLLRNMEDGIQLLHSKLGGTIFIKRDPDVDGYTSSAYLKGFINDISPDTQIICSTSYQKEHGIFIDDIKDIVENINLIIIPDAGSSSVDECKEIKEKYNIPILIIDHHEINTEIMKYTTLINCMDGQYPNNTLSGVGVVHKFCLAYAERYGIREEVCNYYLDLVALGMIADSMDMRNLETRYYALEGLKEQNRHNLLIKELALKYEDDMKLGFTLDSIGWVIAPKMNGLIRYGTPDEQNDLFRALSGEKEDREYQPRRPRGAGKNSPKPPIEIHSLQKTMARVCGNAKERQDKAVREYMKILDSAIQEQHLDQNSVIIIDASEIVDKKTVTGLVANKLAEKYHRPIVILRSRTEEMYGGSGRGYDKGKIDDFRTFLNETKVFECAGHDNAFGVSLAKKDLSKAIGLCNEKLKLDDLVTIHEVDYEVKAENLTSKAVMKVAESYEIWGKGVPEPTFVITDIQIPAKDIIGYGENNGFIKFNYNGIDYIKKYCCKGEWEEMTLRDRNVLGENKKTLHMTIIGNFVLNEWEGQRYPQVKIKFFESEEYIPASKNKVDIDDDFLF
ncbi:MAG: DHH family phosphoesterase [Lachnospiraceae bacterium]|nr:DHH family phosphoesterase [Lachnospiraceae bacterium]